MSNIQEYKYSTILNRLSSPVGVRWGKITGVISTDMILGATLIGMLVGQCAHLLRDNGSVRSGTVSRVIHSI